MKISFQLILLIVAATFVGCTKDTGSKQECDMGTVLKQNTKKIKISSGIWGTVSFMEGNCMPMIDSSNNTCRHCPVNRTVRIYQYTTESYAVPPSAYENFYSGFNTQLVLETKADKDGFFQAAVPAGQYTIVVIEEGKLYSFGSDGQGGISPFTVNTGLQNIDLRMTYKAVF